jgi:hypothetical protein
MKIIVKGMNNAMTTMKLPINNHILKVNKLKK